MAATPTALRDFPDTGLPDSAAAPVAGTRLLDRTAWPRRGLRGPGTRGWCETVGLPFPDRVNTVAHGRGLRVASLGTHELLVVADSRAATVPGIAPDLAGVHDGYRDESWAWLRAEGPGWRDLLAAWTSTDLRPRLAPPGSVVQTRLGSLDVVLLIDEHGVDIFGDIASTGYLLAILRDG